MDLSVAQNCSHRSGGGSASAASNSVSQIGQLMRAQENSDFLDAHANSAANALIYVGVVLVIYVLAIGFIAIRYVLTRASRAQSPPPYYCYSGARRSTVSAILSLRS